MPSENMEPVTFYFRGPDEIPEETLQEIGALVAQGGAVGTAWLDEMLKSAFLIGYALDSGKRVVGCEVLKTPKDAYRKKIESRTGLDLSGYLERGYAAVAEGFRGRGILDTIVKGLIKQAQGRKTYVTTSMNNGPVVWLTQKHGMRLAGRYVNPRTGHEIGVFINR